MHQERNTSYGFWLSAAVVCLLLVLPGVVCAETPGNTTPGPQVTTDVVSVMSEPATPAPTEPVPPVNTTIAVIQPPVPDYRLACNGESHLYHLWDSCSGRERDHSQYPLGLGIAVPRNTMVSRYSHVYGSPGPTSSRSLPCNLTGRTPP